MIKKKAKTGIQMISLSFAIVKIDALSATCTLQNAHYLPCIHETSNLFTGTFCVLSQKSLWYNWQHHYYHYYIIWKIV